MTGVHVRRMPSGHRRKPIAGARRISTSSRRRRWWERPKVIVPIVAALTSAVVIPTSAVFTLVLTQQEIALNEQGQLSERYAYADDQLGSSNAYSRVAGVETLRRIALDVPRESSAVVSRLARFIRSAAPIHYKFCHEHRRTAPEVVDALAAISGLNTHQGEIDLSFTCIRNLTIGDHAFDGVSFYGADLSWSKFYRTNLKEADFGLTNLADASFFHADLASATFCYANLSDVNFRMGNYNNAMIGSSVDPAVLEEPYMSDVRHCLDGSVL